MGYRSYDEGSRSVRAESMSYHTKSADEIFVQNKSHQIHESMEPKKALIREARDSKEHPLSFPIILPLDLTGSMGNIPLHLVREGLPKLMSGIIQHGISDPQLLFLGIGDHTCDRYPLQVGQFECGDEELDMWLTRTYIEKGGGANDGESYLLAWYFAAQHTVTDAWEKRKQKGLLVTIGDEPSIRSLSAHAIEELMGTGSQASYTDKELLALAKEKYEVFHLHIMEGSAGRRSLGYWKTLLGQNCIEVADYRKVPEIIVELVVNIAKTNVVYEPSKTNVIIDALNDLTSGKKDEGMML